jgi:hypothetical protein
VHRDVHLLRHSNQQLGGVCLVVDAQNRVRGYYDTDEQGLDEVFHRAQHVLKEARSSRG